MPGPRRRLASTPTETAGLGVEVAEGSEVAVGGGGGVAVLRGVGSAVFISAMAVFITLVGLDELILFILFDKLTSTIQQKKRTPSIPMKLKARKAVFWMVVAVLQLCFP